jgi:hypothetical protein
VSPQIGQSVSDKRCRSPIVENLFLGDYRHHV